MEILKRNGDRSKYDGSKIVLAIKMAMADISSIVSDDVIDDIESDIQDEIEDSEDIWTVEMISDRVEKSLMSYVSTNDKFYDVAKSYILYRNKQKKERDEVYPYKILTKEFLSKYKHAKNPMSQLGSFVYYRTYSRWLLDKQRREYWWETVARSVDYNCSLAATSKNEAEKLYDNIFNLRQFLSGRTFWVGGTPIVENYKTSNFNCAMTVIDNFNAYKDMFYLLMVGSGVGFRVLKSDVSKLPKVRNEINVLHEYYTPLPKHARREYTGLEFTGDVATINVGDSKEAWSQALDFFIKLHYKKEYRKVNNIIVNYNSVRPYGERLKTFGGFASGHESMLNMLTKIDKIFKKSINKLKTIDCMDIANIIAENVVVGGVRRSAQICMCDADDDEVINAKSNLYTQIGDEWVIDKSISHRSMSNNSIYYFKKPTRERLHWQIEKQRYSGEPGFYNAEAGIIRRSDFSGTNPCGEILLQSKGMCNLTTVNVMAFVNEDGSLDKQALFEAFRLSARAGYRMATVELELEEWDKVQQEDRLIGASFTGWQDMINATNTTKEDENKLWAELRECTHKAADDLANQLGLNKSKLYTAIKPEGTLSQLPVVSSGIHYSHSPYYIRRIRITSSDPLVKVCEELGYPIFPEVGQEMATAKVKVIEFPVKAPIGRTKYDVSAIEQLENYKRSMEFYTDHNTSITVSVKDEEWVEVEQWVWDNWDDVLGISFLSLSDSFYQLLPYEAIDKDEYDKRVLAMKPFNPELLKKYELQQSEEDLGTDSECSTGACGVR